MWCCCCFFIHSLLFSHQQISHLSLWMLLLHNFSVVCAGSKQTIRNEIKMKTYPPLVYVYRQFHTHQMRRYVRFIHMLRVHMKRICGYAKRETTFFIFIFFLIYFCAFFVFIYYFWGKGHSRSEWEKSTHMWIYSISTGIRSSECCVSHAFIPTHSRAVTICSCWCNISMFYFSQFLSMVFFPFRFFLISKKWGCSGASEKSNNNQQHYLHTFALLVRIPVNTKLFMHNLLVFGV